MTLSAKLEPVPGADAPSELLERARRYPFPAPPRSYVLLAGRALELPADGADLSGRRPLLAYGSNASPESLARKLASEPDAPLPMLRAVLDDFDVVYSAHVSPYGAIPAALAASPGTAAPVFVALPTERQLWALSKTEPNYDLTTLSGIDCRCDGELTFTELDAFVSRHGSLSVGGTALALAAVRSEARGFPEMTELDLLEHVSAQLFAELSLEEFVAHCVAAGGLAPLPALPAP